jgi:hypothetical protein
MDKVIKTSMRPGTKVSIKILKKGGGKPWVLYSDYSLRMSRMFGDLSKTIKGDLEACTYDFVEDRVVLSVTHDGQSEQLYQLFEYPPKNYEWTPRDETP